MDLSEKDGDVLVLISKGRRGNSIKYNVSEFLRDYSKLGRWQARITEFATELHEKVKIDIENPVHLPILDGIDAYVDRICKGLAFRALNDGKTELCRIFEGIKVHYCGSLYAGVRVGCTYEADILLEMEEDVDYRTFRTYVDDTCRRKIKLDNWKFLRSRWHKSGTCIVLIYQDPNNYSESVGVLVDLIPVLRGRDEIQPDKLNPKARSYIAETDKPLDMVQFHLPRSSGLDTGYLEHQLLKELPEDVKLGYRVVKFLLQSQLTFTKENIGSRPLIGEDGQSEVQMDGGKLFGYEPIIKSHVLQKFILNLVFAAKGTALEDKFTGSAVTLCLLDMLYKTFSNLTHDGIHLVHPIKLDETEFLTLANKTEFLTLANKTEQGEVSPQLILKLLKGLGCSFFKHVSLGKNCHTHLFDRDKVENPERNHQEEAIQKQVFTGFYQGLSTEEISSAYRCQTICAIPGILDGEAQEVRGQQQPKFQHAEPSNDSKAEVNHLQSEFEAALPDDGGTESELEPPPPENDGESESDRPQPEKSGGDGKCCCVCS